MQLTNLKPCIICDLDGTLANDHHRRKFTGTGWGKKEYEKYYAEMHLDTTHHHIVEILYRFVPDHQIVFVTGRPNEYRLVTENWINRYADIWKSDLYMRPTGDFRCDVEVKSEIYEKHIKPFYNPLFALEDRDRVVTMWRELGIPCLQVAEGAF